ncbi:MAG TPA: helix-turn-helix domain-containing protein [Thermoleophilaceae bacterium]|nr:helix-turn-helix domain-containing protein [Thermoleophilaceae bacterium]
MKPIETNQAAVAAGPLMRADARRNRDAIVAAAYELFAEYGTEAQMDEIARRAGVGVGTLYRHFPAKEDLLDAVIARRFGRLAERAGEAVRQATAGEPWDAFRGYIEWAARVQAGDRALSEAMATRSERMHAAAVGSGLVAEVEQLLDHAKRAGTLREDLVVEDIPAMVCSIGAVAAAAAQKPGWRWDRVIAIWLDGVRAPGISKLPGP